MDMEVVRRARSARGSVVITKEVTTRHVLDNQELRENYYVDASGDGAELVDIETGLQSFVYGFHSMNDTVIVG